MSKRGPGANFGGDEERFGGPGPAMDVMDKPRQATAAQLANRKIAQGKLKRPGASRGASPFTGPPNASAPTGMFGNPAQSAQQQQPVNFSGGINFAFGGSPAPPDQSTNGTSAPPTTFNFGASAPAQQNGFNNPFAAQSAQAQSAAPSFTSTFSSASSQPQQNGFNSQAPSMFNPTPQTNQSFTFGGSQQTNGTTPATSTTSQFGSFGQKPAESAQSTQNGTSTFQFGATQQPAASQDPKPNPFASFGQTPAPTSNQQPAASQDPKPNPFSSFGQTPAPASNLFGGMAQKPQENGTSTLFGGLAQKPQENGTSTLFGGLAQKPQENGNNSFFGASQQPQQPEEPTPKPASSNMFGNLSQKPQENGNNSFFGTSQPPQQPEEPTPKPASSNMFGNIAQKPLDNGSRSLFSATSAEQTPKPATSNLFGNLSQKPLDNGSKSLFSAPPPEQTSKPATSNIFGSMSQSTQQPVQPNSENKGLFGASITAPTPKAAGTGSIFDNIPKKPTSSFVFSSADPSQVYREEDDEDAPSNNNEPASTPFAGFGAPKPNGRVLGGPLFPTSSPQDTSMMTPQSAAPPTSETAKPRSLFDRMDNPNEASQRMGQHIDFGQSKGDETPKATPAPTPATAKPTFTFGQSTAKETPKATPAVAKPTFTFGDSNTAPVTAPVTRTQTAAPAQHSSSSYSHPPLSDLKQISSLRNLNDGMIAHLKSQDPDVDWTTIYLFAAHASAKIRGVPPPSDELALPSQPANGGSTAEPPAQSQPQIAGSATTFNTSTPKAPASSLFNKPPSTAPAGKKRMYEADDQSAQPATEKRSKPNAPPATEKRGPPSPKKRMFEEDTESPLQPGTEKRAKPSEPFQPKLSQNASKTTQIFQGILDKPESSASSGFKPTQSQSSPSKSASTSQPPQTAAVGFKPTGGFTPSIAPSSAGGSNFLSSFGANAKKAEEAERKKRMDEDYDSDDETKEDWEKRDRAEQEAKRQKILDAAKAAPGFKIPTFGASTTAASASTAPTEAEKSQGTGDNTWKPATPIKFGSFTNTSNTPAVAPPSGNLFGNLKPANGGGLAPPSTFSFGSKNPSTNASRATTPGVTTDGETSTAAETGDKDEDEVSAEDANAPRDDYAGLLPEERAENDVLKELQDTKTSKFEAPNGDEKKIWVMKASGRLFVLRNKETGKIRILCKAPQGQVLLNYNPLPKGKYVAVGKKSVQGPFNDHIHATPAALGAFRITTGSAEDGKELLGFLEEGASQ